MKKHKLKKLSLSRSTIKHLSSPNLSAIVAAGTGETRHVLTKCTQGGPTCPWPEIEEE